MLLGISNYGKNCSTKWEVNFKAKAIIKKRTNEGWEGKVEEKEMIEKIGECLREMWIKLDKDHS